jgi:hypothetical protein
VNHRKEVRPLNTLTRSSAQNRNGDDGRAAVADDRRGSTNPSLSANLARTPLSHSHCGWPGILPTSSSSGVGDILFWTTPGAFRYGPIERTPQATTAVAVPAGAGAAFSAYVLGAMRVLSAESSARRGAAALVSSCDRLEGSIA